MMFFLFLCVSILQERRRKPTTTIVSRLTGPPGLGATGVLGALKPRRSQCGGQWLEDMLWR